MKESIEGAVNSMERACGRSTWAEGGTNSSIVLSGCAPLRVVLSKGFATHLAGAGNFTKSAKYEGFVQVATSASSGLREVRKHVREVCSIWPERIAGPAELIVRTRSCHREVAG
jgi:hypothetical protein